MNESIIRNVIRSAVRLAQRKSTSADYAMKKARGLTASLSDEQKTSLWTEAVATLDSFEDSPDHPEEERSEAETRYYDPDPIYGFTGEYRGGFGEMDSLRAWSED